MYFAGHFAPQQMKDAIEIYKELFEPSDVLKQMRKQKLSTSLAQVMISIARGRMQPLQPPTDDLASLLTPAELQMAEKRARDSLIGSEETVKAQLEDFIDFYGEIDELMAVSYIYDQDKQADSYKRLKNVIETLYIKNAQ